MPLLAINLSDKLFQAVKELVEGNKYQTFESFLEIAAFNQLALERGATPSEVIARGHRRGEGDAEPSAQNGTVQVAERAASLAKVEKEGSSPKRRTRQPVGRQAAGAEKSAPAQQNMAEVIRPFTRVTVGEVGPKPLEATEGTQDDHVFGQVNRLFPLKLVCRWITAKVFTPVAGQVRGDWPAYATLSDALADDAAKLGSLLEEWDHCSTRKRDEQLATGLPRRGNSSSRDRFLSQFVARVTRAGDVYPGAICQYALAKFQDAALVLTEQGLAFAQIDSPILDARDKKAPTALSGDELDFLIRQVLGWVPRERDDMKIILTAVREGKVTPPELTTAVQSQFPRAWTQSVTLTHISGLVARLAELRLLRRQWQGRHVQYELGDKVEEFLKVLRTSDRPV
jgi:hypothetical protein